MRNVIFASFALWRRHCLYMRSEHYSTWFVDMCPSVTKFSAAMQNKAAVKGDTDGASTRLACCLIWHHGHHKLGQLCTFPAA